MSAGLALISRAATPQPMALPRVDHDRGQGRDRLQALAHEVLASRPQLIDHWEATAVVESLGYNDARVQREFGLEHTLAVGEYIAQQRRLVGAELPVWSPETEPTLRIIARSAASTLIYAVPWLSVFIAQLIHPNAMVLPAEVGPAVALAMMFSLVISGGFVQAIVRRAEFYVGNKQMGLAREAVSVLMRIGVTVSVIAAAIGVTVGWYFELAGWPALILGADAFVTLSALWMVCGTFTIGRQQWRVAAAFGVGFLAFVVARALGGDVLTAQLVAATALLVAAIAQSHRLFAAAPVRAHIPRPRLSVVTFRTAPYFWYGTAYFSFLFADRLVAGTTATVADATFGIPTTYVAGMELALLSFLLGASGLEVAGALFSRAMVRTARLPFLGDARPLSAALRRHHLRAMGITVVTFVVAASAVATAARLTPNLQLAPESWRLLLVGDAGYLCLAVGLVNALGLFQVGQPWAAVRGLIMALLLNLASGFVLAHVFGGAFASAGLLIGASTFAVASTLNLRRALARPDFSYAVC